MSGPGDDHTCEAPDHDPEDVPGWAHYATAHLHIGGGDDGLRIDLTKPLSDTTRARLRELGLTGAFGIVTAANPRGCVVSPEENDAAFTRLAHVVGATGCVTVPADGMSPDEQHRERGYAIDASRETCAAIARQFQQSAMYWFDGTRFHIVGVLARTVDIPLPRWEA